MYCLFNLLWFSSFPWFILFIFYNLFVSLLNKNYWLPTLYTRHILGSENRAVDHKSPILKGAYFQMWNNDNNIT